MIRACLTYLLFDGPTLSTAVGVLGVVSLVGAAVLVLLQRQREETHKTDTANIASLNSLLETRDLELKVCREEIATLSSEHRQIMQIDVKEIVNAWERMKAQQY